MPLYAGLDFSGNAHQWRAGCRKSNVWLAVVEAPAHRAPVLRTLCRVQELPGGDPPFERLLRFLREASFAAAGIDAPFSVPARFTPRGSHTALLELVDRLPVGSRPFSRGADLIAALGSTAANEPKPLRETERFWSRQGVNVRSTMWNGARGGAPMTAACLKLLAQAGLPVWPWSAGKGLLAEAFPAAQLRAWGLPRDGYNDPKTGAAGRRREIFEGVRSRTGIILPAGYEETVLAGADALAAVLCTFAAKAAAEGAAREQPGVAAAAEGCIAVHR